MLVNVNPRLLVWAREERYGVMPLNVVAGKINIKLSDLTSWETNGTSVPFEALELIAKNYKRQTAVFFLPSVPPKTKKIKDFRNITENEELSPDTLLAIRRTERYLDFARELESSTNWDKQYHWLKDFTGKAENIDTETKNLRTLLETPQSGLIKKYGADNAFRYWRSNIEDKLGLFVFQFSMPETELDGFSCILNNFPYAIVVNNKKPYVRRIFTLFHEIAHILKRQSGVCKHDFGSTKEKFDIEMECNNFSGEFLIPKDSLAVVESADEIYENAKMFNVSSEVYLRRLFEKGKLNRDVFFEWLNEIRERTEPRKAIKGHPNMIINSKSSRGNKFFNIITNAAVSNKISFSLASDLLGLKVGSINI